MFLKKVDGPRSVTLPDGSIMTHADLPPASTRSWVVSRKAAEVRGVVYSLLSQSDALSRYSLSEEELESWCDAGTGHGLKALRATHLQSYRKLYATLGGVKR